MLRSIAAPDARRLGAPIR